MQLYWLSVYPSPVNATLGCVAARACGHRGGCLLLLLMSLIYAAFPGGLGAQESVQRNRVVAVVNRQIFTAGDLDYYVFDYRLRRPQAFDRADEELRRELVTTALDDFLLGAWAETQVQKIPDEAIEASLKGVYERFEHLSGGAKQFEALVRESGIDAQGLRLWARERARQNIAIREAIVMRANLGGKGPYDGKVADAVRIRLAHIFASGAGADEALVMERVLKIRRDVEAGLPFAEAARLYSDDTGNANNGGELGWFEETELDPGLWSAAKATSFGAVSEPVIGQRGIHLLKVLDFETPDQMEYLELVREEERKQLRRLREQSDFLLADGYTLKALPESESSVPDEEWKTPPGGESATGAP